jgi:circadian clock protein KaiB
VRRPLEADDEGLGEVFSGAPEQFYELTLYVNGASDLSSRAIEEAQKLCESQVAGRYHLSMVDINTNPTALQNSGVLATPTLVKYLPRPVRHLVGDIANGDWSVLPYDSTRGSSASPRGTEFLARTSTTSDDIHALEQADNKRAPKYSQTFDLGRVNEMEETMRAIRAGEVDGFVVSDCDGGQCVFTLISADHPYRMFVENMRD